MNKLALIFLLSTFVMADLASGFVKYSKLPDISFKNPSPKNLKVQNKPQKPAGLKDELIAMWKAQMPALIIDELKFIDKVPANCSINSASKPIAKGFIRAECSGKFKYIKYLLKAHVIGISLSRDVERSEAINFTNTTLVSLPLSAAGANLLTSLDANAKAKTRLKAGTLLRKVHLEPLYVIKKNDLINVKFKDQSLTISSQATALNSAVKGARVLLKMPNGKKISAIAISNESAEIR